MSLMRTIDGGTAGRAGLLAVGGLLAVAGIAAAQTPLRMEIRQGPGLSSNFFTQVLAGYNDNLFLDSAAGLGTLTQHLVPHFDLDLRRPGFNVNLDYTGDFRFYDRGGDRLKHDLHYTRSALNWDWHRNFRLIVDGDLSDQPIDLSKGGGISSQALYLGRHFRPPAVNSTLILDYGVQQKMELDFGRRVTLELGYRLDRTQAAGGRGRNAVSHGPDLDLLFTLNKQLDLGVSGFGGFTDYEGDYLRRNGRVLFETIYAITPMARLQLGVGVQRMWVRDSGNQLTKQHLAVDSALEIMRGARTRFSLDYGRRFISDVFATVFMVDELGVGISHLFTRRLTMDTAVFARKLELMDTRFTRQEEQIRDWMLGIEWEAEFAVTPAISPMFSAGYVLNRGRFSANDFQNLRLSTGFSYHFFSLN